MYDADHIIENLNLKLHPEGGYFSEIYRNNEKILKEHLPGRYQSDRNFGTSIYFLLNKIQVSKFHILQSDEIWYYHLGSSIELHLLHPDGQYEKKILGPNYTDGESLSVIIPRHTWFGANLLETDKFGLVSCTVYPGFDFDDFRLAEREELLGQFPEHKNIIIKLTDDDGTD